MTPLVSIRRADLMMVLAYATDLATGQSRDFALRSSVLAMRLADALGLDPDLRRQVFHHAILRYIGCNADTHLLARAFGDEIALRQDLAITDIGSLASLGGTFATAFRRHFADLPPDRLEAAVQQGLAEVIGTSVPILSGHCEVAARIGLRIGLDEQMQINLRQLYERWDGKGLPNGLSGQTVRLPVRIVTLAQDAIALEDRHGRAHMLAEIGARRDGPYEAALADLFLADPDRFMAGMDASVTREEILALEPAPIGLLDARACEEALIAIADMIDMRMPQTFGHSRAVAALGAAAAKCLGLPDDDIRTIRWAGYLHDLGELSVPVSTWMKPAPMSRAEADAAQLHPYYGEKALASLGTEGRPVAALVLRHHERLDGTGYHRNARAPDLSPAARILAATEAYATALEDRPHRPALGERAAATRLRDLVKAGKLCPDATEAVLAAAGQAARRSTSPGIDGLTPREIEVLRLIASGLTAKEAAIHLAITPKTAGNHIQNLYAKIGVSTRAGAALYALERGLVAERMIAA